MWEYYTHYKEEKLRYRTIITCPHYTAREGQRWDLKPTVVLGPLSSPLSFAASPSTGLGTHTQMHTAVYVNRRSQEWLF